MKISLSLSILFQVGPEMPIALAVPQHYPRWVRKRESTCGQVLSLKSLSLIHPQFIGLDSSDAEINGLVANTTERNHNPKIHLIAYELGKQPSSGVAVPRLAAPMLP